MITKVSEITVEDLKSYLRISDDLSEDDIISIITNDLKSN